MLALATSQDHKRLLDGDRGPNTGGMGAYSPAPVVTPNVHARVMHEIVLPTLAGMAAEGRPFSGFLYAGLMIDAHGAPKTVEFNCRLGDPEAQVILMRLKSDLFELLLQAAAPNDEHPLDEVELHWDRRVALGVVMAAAGYPAAPRARRRHRRPGQRCRADRRGGAEHEPTAKVFHAGTALRGDEVVTAGGRVLCVTALGETTRLAQQRAYEVAAAGRLRRRAVAQRHRPARDPALSPSSTERP